MATVYTRTYTFAKRSNSQNERVVPLSNFAISGDTTHTIKRITSITYEHYHSSTGSPTWALRGVLVFGDGSTLISDTVSHTFNGDVYKYTNTFTTLPTPEKFASLTEIRTINDKGTTNNSGYSYDLYWRATSSQPMKLIVTFTEEPPVYYSPKVDEFKLARINSSGVVDDEGTNVATSIKISLGNTSAISSGQLRIYYEANSYPEVGVSKYIDLSSKISSLLTGVTNDKTIITGTWNISSSWYFAVVFVMGEETDIGTASIPRAGGSLHISNQHSGGICVAGYSSGTTSNPKFETYAPAYLYGGIAQIGMGGGGSLLELIGVQVGKQTGSDIASGKTIDYTITFAKSYASTPTVVLGMTVAGDDISHYSLGRISCAVISTSTTGFTVRAYNYSGASGYVKIGFNWAAFGTLA